MPDEPVSEFEYQVFARRVERLTGLDLKSYKRPQMERRLHRLMERYDVADFGAFARLLERDPAVLRVFLDYVTINVSEFFRNPEYFEYLETQLPDLIGARGLNAWSAGCSHGQEAFSLAILAEEHAPGKAHRIWATDIDRAGLDAVRAGRYPEMDLRAVTPERLRKWFTQEDGQFVVNARLRSLVQVAHHDLMADPFPEGMDLICCRNVVIYFTEAAKETLWKRFAGALRPGGMLFVGGTERVFRPARFGLVQEHAFFYRRSPSEPTGVTHHG